MNKKIFDIGVVGATGLVGEVFLELLLEREFPVEDLRLFASDKSDGQTLNFKDTRVPLQTLKPGCFRNLDLVFFSAGEDIAKTWAPEAIRCGAFVVDNSSAFRMDKDVPLIVPEVNGSLLPPAHKPSIIANPNCSTIQLVMALEPLRRDFGLDSVTVASYQAVSGAGKAARAELVAQVKSWLDKVEEEEWSIQNFPHPIAFNCLPQIGSFGAEGFCSEEMKIMLETQKILNLPELPVSAFTVRIPAWNAHSEAVWVRLKRQVSQADILQSLGQMSGIEILDLPKDSIYPYPLMASDTNPVYVGRIHQDLYDRQRWLMWIVADNLRKGAALNGIQIAERIFDI